MGYDSRIVIIGGGFIGLNLAKRLTPSYDRVTVFDRNLPTEPHADPATFVQGDFLDIKLLKNIIAEHDIVIHCLSTTTPSSSNQDPIFDISTNLIGSVNLLKAMVECNTKKIIFVSSGGTVYGLNQYPKEDDPRMAICSYGIVKSAVEDYICMYSYQYHLEYMILRLTNPYGPMQKPGNGLGVIGNFLDCVIKGLPITIFGDGTATRDYIYIDDFSQIVETLIRQNQWNIITNVGSGYSADLNTLCELIVKNVSDRILVNRVEKRSCDLNVNSPKTDRLRELIPKFQFTNIEDGIKKYYRWLTQS